jgi:hypothetical protein
MFQPKQLSLSISMAACLWGAMAPAASAAPVTVPVGVSGVIVDAAGSGRSAQVVFNGGASNLKFSVGAEFDGVDDASLGGAVAAFNVANLKVTSGGVGTTVVETSAVGWGGDPFRSGTTVSNNLASASIDTVTGAVSMLSVAGSLNLSGTRIGGVLNGGSATVSNIRFDLANKQVLADLDGVSEAVGTVAPTAYSMHDTALWTFASATGATALPPSALFLTDPVTGLRQSGYTILTDTSTISQLIGYTPGGYVGYVGCSGSSGGYGYGGYYAGSGCYYSAPQPIYTSTLGFEVSGQTHIDGLQLTASGADFLSKSLGFKTVANTVFKAVPDYGSVTITTNYVLGVPEPSTYALMALGLGLMACAVRRNKRLGA